MFKLQGRPQLFSRSRQGPSFARRLWQLLLKPLSRHPLWFTLRQERIFLLFGCVIALAFLGAVGFALCEASDQESLGQKLGHGLWWAIVTITTVGYGDVVPQTTAGRFLGVLLMLTGLISLSLLTATVASVFVERKIRKEKGLETISDRQHLVLLGWNRGGEQMLRYLSQRLGLATPLVLVNNLPPEVIEPLINAFPNLQLRFVRGDFQREEILERANLAQARQVVILADRSDPSLSRDLVDQRTLLAALMARSLNPRIKITAELIQAENRPHLERALVDDIVIRGEYDSALLACSTESSGMFRILRTLLSPEGHNIWSVPIPSAFHGRSVKELAAYFRQRQALLIALYAEGYKIRLEELLSPEPTAIDEFIARKFAESGKTHLFGRHQVEIKINPPDDHLISPREVAVVIANRPLTT